MKKPNILLLYADQHSAKYMSCAGDKVIHTPHMDRLAEEGVMFTDAYTPMPLCVPGRVAHLTGRYGHSTGIMHNNNRQLCREEPTFPQALVRAGYHTVHMGKTHLAQACSPGQPEFESRLREMGFEEAHGHGGKVACASPNNKDSMFDDEYMKVLKQKGVFDKFHEDYKRRQNELPHYYNAPSVLNEEDFHDAFIGARTAEWISGYTGDKPFFVWCNWGGPHSPWDAPGKYASMYEPADMEKPTADEGVKLPAALQDRMKGIEDSLPPGEAEKCKANYYGMINVVDDAIGAILSSLEKKGILENTIVIYSSDHGEMMYDHSLLGKSVFFDGSVKVPCIIRYPEAFQQGLRSDALANTIDLVPTLLECAGADAMSCMHGTSMLPVLTGEKNSYQNAVFSELGGVIGTNKSTQLDGLSWKMVREAEWKYVYNPVWEKQILFNVEEDPDESNNLSGDPVYSAIESRLRTRILDWIFRTEYSPR